MFSQTNPISSEVVELDKISHKILWMYVSFTKLLPTYIIINEIKSIFSLQWKLNQNHEDNLHFSIKQNGSNESHSCPKSDTGE